MKSPSLEIIDRSTGRDVTLSAEDRRSVVRELMALSDRITALQKKEPAEYELRWHYGDFKLRLALHPGPAPF
jgi:hypothetical protein